MLVVIWDIATISVIQDGEEESVGEKSYGMK